MNIIPVGLAPIPNFQDIPFPAPLWFLKACLVIGFFLHAIPMNVTLTGGLVASVLIGYGHWTGHPYSRRLGKALGKSLPFFVSVAITQGIVPLLFLQLIYGPLFYTSSILIAVPWLLVILLLLIAYYSYYLYTYEREIISDNAGWILAIASLLFLVVAFIFSNNMTLMLTPHRWLSLYQNNAHGINLNLGDPQLLPRYLHFVIAAFAVTGLTIGCFGLYWYQRDLHYGSWLIRLGAGMFILFTLLQIPVGIWFMLSLQHGIMMNYLGADFTGTALFTFAMVLDLIGLIAMGLAWREGNPAPFRVGLVSSLVVIFLMVIIRHLLRVYSTQSFFTAAHVAVQPQYLLLALFIGGFIIGVLYIGWLLKITWDAFHHPVNPL